MTRIKSLDTVHWHSSLNSGNNAADIVGFDSEGEGRELLEKHREHINKRLSTGNVTSALLEVHSESFDPRADENPIITIWVNSHNNDSKVLPAEIRGFRKLDDAEIDMRRM